MIHKIKVSEIQGEVQIQSSKSYVQRALAATVHADGDCFISNPGYSHDIMTAIEITENSGMEIFRTEEGDLSAIRRDDYKGGYFNFGDSGLCARLFPPLLAVYGENFIVDGSPTLRNRQVAKDIKQLEKLGLKIKTDGNKLPLIISDYLQAGSITLDTSRSSQFLSGLLMALPLCVSDSFISYNKIVSRPYVDITIEVLKDTGIDIFETNKGFNIPGNQVYKAFQYKPEGDWSSAVFLMVAAALCGDIKIKNLNKDTKQADIKILDVFDQAGVDYFFNENNIKVVKSKPSGFELDLTDNPDLFPAIIPLALAADSKCIIKNTYRLIKKESNRLKAVIKEFSAAGGRFETVKGKDELIIYPSHLNFAEFDSHNDHRIAMSLAVASMANNGGVIRNSGCVAKSWPDFFEVLKKNGGKIYE